MGGTGWQVWEVREASGKKSLQLMAAITMIVLKPQRSFFKLLHSLQIFLSMPVFHFYIRITHKINRSQRIKCGVIRLETQEVLLSPRE